MKARLLCVWAVLSLLSVVSMVASPLAWSTDQQQFWYEGPAWLATKEQRAELMAAPEGERAEIIKSFLEDPDPETALNELEKGVELRRQLVQNEILSFIDDRARLLFVSGIPQQRELVDCGAAFLPMEVWTYGPHRLLLYQEAVDEPYRLWLPTDGKRLLYTREMEYWLEEWEIYKKLVSGRRIDRRLCPEAELIDEVTGIDGMFEIINPPFVRDLLSFMGPVQDLAAWARQAVTTVLPELPPQLIIQEIGLEYPRRRGLRLDSRVTIALSPESPIEPFVQEDTELLRLTIEGVIETEDTVFEDFRIRFEIDKPEEGVPIVLAFEQPLRRNARYRVRMRIRDEIGDAEVITSHLVEVPDTPDYSAPPPLEAGTPLARLGEQLSRSPDGLILLVPPREVVFGSLRVQAVVSGKRIDDVAFIVDGKKQLTKKKAPFTAALVLPRLPKEVVVRAEGYDTQGELVHADEVVLNQPKGRLEVEILEPARGVRVDSERFAASAQVVVPEGRRVETLEFHLNDRVVATLTTPPWQVELDLPFTADGMVFMTAVALLDDGSRAEDVRFLSSPHEMGALDVRLVELYTTVLGRKGIVRGLSQGVFSVFEDGRAQKITKFELVEDLPLTIGVTLDVSGSMYASLGAARRAATEFLDNIVGPRDQCFAVAFASEPSLVMHRTPDPGAVKEALEAVDSGGWTALHDAVVFSLYYYRGVTGRRALVLLSDGDDTDSRLDFETALDYAKGSGVVIYTIGLKNDALDGKAKSKLRKLAHETGGRSFFIEEAEELSGVYAAIEEELRSQYLLAYASDHPQRDGQFRSVKVEVKGSGLQARTIQGYIP